MHDGLCAFGVLFNGYWWHFDVDYMHFSLMHTVFVVKYIWDEMVYVSILFCSFFSGIKLIQFFT